MPQTVESWIFIGIACVLGFFIGQWIRNRRKKSEAASEALMKMAQAGPRKRLSKKERLRDRRRSQ